MSALEKLCGGVPSALLFDLDGTLVDSAPDLADALDAALAEYGFAPAREAAARRWVGNGARKLVQRGLAHALGTAEENVDDTLLAGALEAFFAHYQAYCARRSTVYDGVIEALSHWRERGIAMACVTNKPLRFTQVILAHYGLDRFLTVAVGGDSLPVRKPDPLPLLHACEQLMKPANAAVMVGDSRNDILAARAAGMMAVCVPYGYNYGVAIADDNPDLVVERLDALL